MRIPRLYVCGRFYLNPARKTRIFQSGGGTTVGDIRTHKVEGFKVGADVIVGENPGSKYEKAQKLALNILDEKAIIDMIES